MFKLKQMLMQEAGEDGGGGGQGPQITAEVQAIIDAQVSQAVTGLKAKNAELLGKIKTAGDQLKEFEGIDPNAVRSILQRFGDEEEAKLIASGKVDEVINQRTERMKQGFEKETAKERQAREAAENRAEKLSRRALESGVRQEASIAGLHPQAVDDALLAALVDFTIDDEGNPVAKEGRYGKDGNPLKLKEWFAEKKDTRPHWFPATANGGGAQQGGGGNNGAKPGNFGGSREERLAAIKAMTKSV